MNDGKRKVTSICELEGFAEDRIKLKEIFKFNQLGLTESGSVEGEFVLYKNVPRVYKKLISRGINDLEDIFGKFINK